MDIIPSRQAYMSASCTHSPLLQEALFQMQLKEAEAAAWRSTGLVSGKDGARVGSTPPTAEELASMAAARAASLATMQARKQEAAVHRWATGWTVLSALCSLVKDAPPGRQ